MYYIENPFVSASSRDIVEAADFIGREHDLQQIEDRVILPKGQRASVAIIGLPDIGKHCLINRALLAHKSELHQRKLVPIEIDLASYTETDKHDKFFRDLISFCKYELEDEDLKFATSQITDIAQMTKDALQEWDEGRTISSLKGFFRNVLKVGIRVIFILDNFDHADSLFKEHIDRIKWLRDLAGSECRITWIALTSKPIREIKRIPKSISDDLFREHRLGMFLQEDLETYFQSLSQIGISLLKEQKKTTIAYCGNHPYLLSLLGYHLVEDYAQQPDKIDIDHTFRKVEERFHQSYDRVINLVLDSDNRLQKLSQMLFGSTANLEQKDIDRMLAYGLIYPNPTWSSAPDNSQPAYVAFSEHFQNYLYTKFSTDASLSESEQAINRNDPFSWSQTMYPESLHWKHYKIIKQVETTKHSQVAKAWDTAVKRHVAIKRLYLDQTRSEETIKDYQRVLEREAEILGSLEHKNIGKIYTLENDPPSLIMQWIEGESLADILKRENRLPLTRVLTLGITLAQTLQYIHTKKQPVIHRDIKPGNIILRDDGEPILIDFDIARATSQVETAFPYDEQGNTHSFRGTKYYAAPEQSTHPKGVTDRIDIYALGVVLYEALTGGDTPDQPAEWDRPPDKCIPAPLWSILRATLSEDPQNRPDAQQLAQQLEQCLQEIER